MLMRNLEISTISDKTFFRVGGEVHLPNVITHYLRHCLDLYQKQGMSFRKRNVVVSSPGSAPISQKLSEKDVNPGVRPSPLDARLTTSTGTRSLDTLLGGHAGLALGTSLLIEEGGTTDFAGALLRYYAAEGVVQGHHVHVLGVNEAWTRDLPGVSTSSGTGSENKASGEKMKIAWRYERLGEFGRGSHSSCNPIIGATVL
jgi:elongator complex protein 4